MTSLVDARPAVANQRPPWYVAHCKPKSERIARDHLERQGYICYLPLIKVYSPRKASLVRLDPMFPRYLFCQPGTAEQSIAPIRSTTGVMDLIRFGNKPAQLDEAVVYTIRDVESAQHQQKAGELSGLVIGQWVRIQSGALSNLEGLVSQIANERVTILLELLGKTTAFELNLAQIGKA